LIPEQRRDGNDHKLATRLLVKVEDKNRRLLKEPAAFLTFNDRAELFFGGGCGIAKPFL
jgi:hypothetical protein